MSRLVLSFLVVFLFFIQSVGNCKDVINNQTIAAAYIDGNMLYSRIIDGLENIDHPKNVAFWALAAMVNAQIHDTILNTQDKNLEDCLRQKRFLLGAIEMYIMDVPGAEITPRIETLVSEGYLRSNLSCPVGGEYITEGDFFEGKGIIKCSTHGSYCSYNRKPDISGTYKKANLKKMIDTFLAFHGEEILQPNGSIFAAVDNNLDFRVSINGKFKPDIISQIIKDLQLMSPESTNKNMAVYKIQLSAGNILNIIITAEQIRVIRNDKPETDLEGWQSFIAHSKDAQNVFVLEQNTKRFIQIAKSKIAAQNASRCIANMELLQNAVKYFNLYQGHMDSLDINRLIDSNFLRFPPNCLDGGNYECSGNLRNNLQIQCSLHGSTSKPTQASHKRVSIELPKPELAHLSRIQVIVSNSNTKLLAETSCLELKARLIEAINVGGVSKAVAHFLPDQFAQLAEVHALETAETFKTNPEHIIDENMVLGHYWPEYCFEGLLNHFFVHSQSD